MFLGAVPIVTCSNTFAVGLHWPYSMYHRLAAMHSVTDRQTDDSTVPIADHILYATWSAVYVA